MADAPQLPVLMRAATIRERCLRVTQWVEAGKSQYWRVDRSRLESAVSEVASVALERFPDLRIPFHSRWRHFESAGIDRTAELALALSGAGFAAESEQSLAARIDLCVISVLLDAGAGPHWVYTDRLGSRLQRSEGLGVASFEAFTAGRFANSSDAPLRGDAQRLAAFDLESLATLFQVRDDNLLEGLQGRLQLLVSLGRALLGAGLDRVSDLYRPLLARTATASSSRRLPASALLETTVHALAPVWVKASEAPDGSRGDLWPHPAARSDPHGDPSDGWVAFHKLSQWLCYSLIEPLQAAGFVVADLDALTGLPEYRNGGLLVDCGVIALRDRNAADRIWLPGDTLVTEWRALTVALIDELAGQLRIRLDRTAQSLPLASILEGGTWAAGRRLAQKYRNGRPPLEVDTAGTLF
jgi:hypothetical protein